MTTATTTEPSAAPRRIGDYEEGDPLSSFSNMDSEELDDDLLWRLDSARLTMNRLFSAIFHDVVSASRLKDRYDLEHRRVLERAERFIEVFTAIEQPETN